MQNKIIYIISIFIICLYAAKAAEPGFIENRGQWESCVNFYSAAQGAKIWLTDSSVVYDFYRFDKIQDNVNYCDIITQSPGFERGIFPYLIKRGNIVSMKLAGANKLISVPEKKINTYNNYFIGNDPSRWQTDIHLYSELVIKDVYPKIDLRYYYENSNLRYDYIVREGGNPGLIKAIFTGADSIFTKSNELYINTAAGSIIQNKLLAYQVVAGEKMIIPCKFNVINDTVSFSAVVYDKNHVLIIDPMIYSTFWGGKDYDVSRDIAIDSLGNAYIVGYTSSNDFPATIGAYCDTLYKTSHNYPDIFVSKLDSSGKQPIFSTYIGSAVEDYGQAIALDDSLNVYITGYTNKTITFPVTSRVYDSTANGGFDAFIIKLSPRGDYLKFSTLIGGIKDDFARDILVDKSDNSVIISGYTIESSGYPTSPNAYQKDYKGLYDSFITKISSNARNLVFSTLIGGEKDDFCQSVSMDNLKNLYITGMTKSRNYPITGDAFDWKYNDTSDIANFSDDVFVNKFNPDCSLLQYSSYLGGESKDGAYKIINDNSNNFYVTGYTESKNFPVTFSAVSKTYSNWNDRFPGDVFVSKFNSSGRFLDYSTFIGGSNTDRAYSMKLDKFNNAYITGITNSPDFPVTKAAFDTTFNDTSSNPDGFLSIVNAKGNRLYYSTYIGGTDADVCQALAVLNTSVYLTGITSSFNFPVTKGVFDSVYNDRMLADGFVTKLEPDYYHIGGGEDKIICYGSNTIIESKYVGGFGQSSYTWTPGFTLSDTHSPNPTASPVNSTTYTLRIQDEEKNVVRDTVLVTVIPLPIVTVAGPDSVLFGHSATYTATRNDTCTYQWLVQGGVVISGIGSNIAIVKWTDSTKGKLDVIMTDKYGCFGASSINNINITSKYRLKLLSSGSTTFCYGDSVILDAGSGYSEYIWSNKRKTQYDTVWSNGSYWCIVTNSDGLKGFTDTIYVLVIPGPPKPTIIEKDYTLWCQVAAPNYQWYIDGVKIPGANKITFKPVIPGDYQVEVFVASGCSQISDKYHVVTVSVSDNDILDFKIYPNPNQGIFTIESKLPEISNRIEIRLSNLLGQFFYTYSEIDIKNEIFINIDVSMLPKGIYFLDIYYGNWNKREKIVID